MTRTVLVATGLGDERVVCGKHIPASDVLWFIIEAETKPKPLAVSEIKES